MATMREWFDGFTAETGETPDTIVFGWEYDWARERGDWPEVDEGALVAFSDVPASMLDRPFDDSYGGNRTPNLAAWSPSWVLFSDNYDGAETLQWVPRHPTPHTPIRPGGG